MAINIPKTYIERKAATTVDWGAIGKQVNESMIQLETDRKNQRAEIEKNSREIATTLDNAPLGQHAGRNEALLEYADNAKQAMLMLDREMKAGNISVKDYTIAVQNLKDGTNQAFDIMEEWNKNYDQAMARMTNCGQKDANGVMIDCSAAQEQFQMMQAESLGKLDTHALFINPSNFKVTLGKRATNRKGELTGGLSDNQNDFAELSQLRNRVNQKINRYDLEGNMNNVEKMLSTEYNRVKLTGNIKSVKDARENPYFKKSINNWITSMMTNEVDVGSMLTDYMKFNPNTGEQWNFTMDPREANADENLILLVNDPERPASGYLVPDFSSTNGKKQHKAVYDMIYQNIQGMLDRQETPMPTSTLQTQDNEKRLVSNIARLWYGQDAQDITSVIGYLEGVNPNMKIKVTEDDVLVTTVNADGNTVTKTYNKGDDQKQFIESIITQVSGGKQMSGDYLENAGLDLTRTRGTGTGEMAVEERVAITPWGEATKETIVEGKKTLARPKDQFATALEDVENNSAKNADNLVESVSTSMDFLPSVYTRGGVVSNNNANESDIEYVNAENIPVKLNDNDESSVSIYYPELMTLPIIVPTEGEGGVNLVEQVTKTIFDSASQSQKLAPVDFKRLLGDEEFMKYNNAELFLHLGLIDFTGQWNDGEGTRTPKTNAPPRNTINYSTK